MDISQATKAKCEKLAAPEKITNYLKTAKCLKESIQSNGKKDAGDCYKILKFPEYAGVCTISGVCSNYKDEDYEDKNDTPTFTMNNRFDLQSKKYADKVLKKLRKNTSQDKDSCLARAVDYFHYCNNDQNNNQPITAKFVSKRGDVYQSTYPPECTTKSGKDTICTALVDTDNIWDSRGSDSDAQFSCWRPKAAAGYVSLGDLPI